MKPANQIHGGGFQPSMSGLTMMDLSTLPIGTFSKEDSQIHTNNIEMSNYIDNTKAAAIPNMNNQVMLFNGNVMDP